MSDQKEAWQSAVATVRDKNVERLQGYMDILDQVILAGSMGAKIDKNLVEALKAAIRFFDPSKEEKISSIGRNRAKVIQDDSTIKMELRPEDEEKIRALIG